MCIASKHLGTVTAAAVVLTILSAATAQYGGGSGTPEDPYQIWTPEQMNAIGADPNDWDKHFKLMADIDLSAFDGRNDRPGFNIIGPDNGGVPWKTGGRPFSGVFDGNGHTISNFHCYTEGRDYVALFGYVEGPGADIRYVRLVNPTVNAQRWGGSYVGSLVGLLAGGTIAGCCVEDGTITGDTWVGGLVGGNRGYVTQCYSATTVTTEGQAVGGLIGVNAFWGVVSQCWSVSSVTGGSGVGGLVAQNHNVVICCYSAGRVSCSSWGHAGGLMDYNGQFAVVKDCFWDTQTSGQAHSAAGTGLTTNEMQNIQLYLDAGWDWVGETGNGTCELWQIPTKGGYPRLTIFADYTPRRPKGLGTPKDPYRVSDAGELGAMVHCSPYAHYRLAASIDLSGIHWRTAVIPWFAGTFDGNGMTIQHAKMEGVDLVGLFGQLAPGANVHDLGVVDVNIVASQKGLVGALAGGNAGTLTRCYSTGTVAGNLRFIGGLVGENSGAMVQCQSSCAVDGNHNVGGLVGYNRGSLARCHSTGAASGRSMIGGLVGNNSGRVAECYSTATASTSGGHVGGLAGSNCGDLADCYSTGDVSGYAAGGLVGGNLAGVFHCYSTGTVSGWDFAGGLIGANESGVTGCFWDSQTSGQPVSAGGRSKTTAEMQTASTFLDAGWDFVGETANGTEDIWWILEGKDYPRLWWEAAVDPNVATAP